jgi:quinol monooxygenase YgiN
MSVIVVAEFPTTEQGAQDFIDWSKSDDRYVITRQHKGFEDIRTFLAEDKKTIYLYEKWNSKEDHQAYLDFRVKDGLMDFLNPRLDGDFKVTYFSEE